MTERLDFVTDEHLKYLDDLRASGNTNMYGAAPFIQGTFGIEKHEAKAVLSYWMDTFGERHG